MSSPPIRGPVPGVLSDIAGANVRNLLLVNGAVLLFALWFVFGARASYFGSALTGPRVIDPADPAAFEAAVAREPLWIALDVQPDPEPYFTTTKKSKTVAWTYGAEVADKMLLCRRDETGPPASASGLLESLPSDDQSWFQRETQYKFPVHEVRVDVDASRGAGVGWLLFWLATIALTAWNVVKGVQRLSDPWSAPSFAPLRGAEEGAVAAAKAIDAEVAAAGKQPISSAVVGSTWILVRSMFHFEAIRTHDLLWAYAHVTEHRKWGVIKTGESHEAKLVLRNGETVDVTGTRGSVQVFLSRVRRAAPWAYSGWSKELETWAEKRLAELAAAVDERRASGTSAPAEDGESGDAGAA